MTATQANTAPSTSNSAPLIKLAASEARNATATAPDEIMVLFALATRGRLHARLGGLRARDVKGNDGLR